MVSSQPRSSTPVGRGLPLLIGAVLSTGVSILLWSAVLAGFSMLR